MSDELYQAAIINLAKKARAIPRLDAPDRTATVDNPLCGDRVTLDFRLDAEGDAVADVGHRTRGCLLCEAAAYLIAEHAIGHDPDELEARARHLVSALGDDQVSMADLWPGLEILAPVRRFKSRHDCVTLPFQAIIKAFGAQA